MSAHVVQWVAPTPLWGKAIDERKLPDEADRVTAMQKPAILRFASDDFMQDLAGLLERDPASVGKQVAIPRSFTMPCPGAVVCLVR